VDAWILFLIISGSFYLFPHIFLQLTAFLSRIPMRSYLKTPVWFLGWSKKCAWSPANGVRGTSGWNPNKQGIIVVHGRDHSMW